MTPAPLHLVLAERAVNSLLRLDPELGAALGRFAGTRIEIRVRSLAEPVVATFLGAGEGVALGGATSDAPAAVTITGSAVALMRMLANPSDDAMLRRAEVTISGDVVVAAALRDVLARADFDWEEVLATRFGDAAGHEMGRGIRAAAAFLGAAGRRFGEDVSEFLLHEGRLAPRRDEVGAFADSVDEIRDDVERLAARLARLEAGRGGGDGDR